MREDRSKPGRVVVGFAADCVRGTSEIRAWDPATGERETVSAGTHCNDIVVHHAGHIYYTDSQAGKVWHLAPGHPRAPRG